MNNLFQEVIFDKEKRKVSMMSSRFFEKHLLGYRRISKLNSGGLYTCQAYNI